ncbi:hypothetical protein [Salidesulfovibrio brasiliensis]|uniref:hypothetical protein n=1 Tax=Salidesulfovibrio brasiliensis TaxID=221711 RepID=UPI0006D23961|nr:hypothetical protein [Salidesulfovibrio brasiliensis]
MTRKRNPEDELRYLRERVAYLEESQRMTLDALGLASELGTFHPRGHEAEGEMALLDETLSRLRRLMRFREAAIYLVDETMNFVMAVCEPPDAARALTASSCGTLRTGPWHGRCSAHGQHLRRPRTALMC